MKMKKFLCVILASMAVMCSFAGCGGSDSANDTTDNGNAATADADTAAADVSATADKIKSEISFEDELIEIDSAKIEKVLGVAPDSYTKAKVYISSSGATPEEIACFEAPNGSMATTIDAALKARLTAQKNTFTDYKPEQAPKLDSAVLKTVDNCVYFVVSGDSAKAEEIIG